ncbi:MAG TPA: TlpA disulfide reductase family protein [Polyangiaceae bacterium]
MTKPIFALSALFAVLAASACDEHKTPPVTVTRERSQAVMGTSPAPDTQTLTSVAPDAPKVVGEKLGGMKPPRRLCGGALSSKGSELSGEPMARRAAEGERDLPEKLTFSTQYTWINFWAAWCVPCKEEIPRLLDWEKRLTAAGIGFKVLFVSLDDDERQLTAFLGKQPPNGLRRSYWLDDGAPRTDWLAKVGMKPDMELPAHLLVDASAKVRCKIQGAIEDSDYAQLLGLLNGSR